MKKKKQLDCQLHCKSTAKLDLEVSKELCQKDRCLASLLGNEEEEGNTDETKDSTKDST